MRGVLCVDRLVDNGVDPAELEGLRKRLNREDLDSSYSWDWEPLP